MIFYLQELDAEIVSKTAQWHTFMLKVRSGKSKKEKKQIKQKPTKATNEEEVSEADRQLHKKIAVQVKAKGKSSESVETFETFYELIKQETWKLQKEYQPQLSNGIKIAVDLVQVDKKDVDIKVEIAPNKTVNLLYKTWVTKRQSLTV